ncbi:Hypothetical protein NTJ_10358 [Nesidiocoris tenuis]|uniref:Uncharacterized protein n=1 Tax=Nesidiocoris tenuis TaxID=355587 RepID=A0ABN7AZE3_9HEMI|nr:Hypothetical protein NTJ_10358 [Nesidiocoris tenuis]
MICLIPRSLPVTWRPSHVDCRPPPVDCRPPPVDCRPPPVDCRPPPVDCRPPPDDCRPKSIACRPLVFTVLCDPPQPCSEGRNSQFFSSKYCNGNAPLPAKKLRLLRG